MPSNSEFVSLLKKARTAYADRRGDAAAETRRMEAAHAVVRTPQFMSFCKDNAVLDGKCIPTAKFLKMIAFDDSYSEFKDVERMTAKYDACLEYEGKSTTCSRMSHDDIDAIHGADYKTRHFRYVKSSPELNTLRKILTTRFEAVEAYIRYWASHHFTWPEASPRTPPRTPAPVAPLAPIKSTTTSGCGAHDDAW